MPFEQMPDAYLVITDQTDLDLNSQRVQFNRVLIPSEQTVLDSKGFGQMEEKLYPLCGIQIKPGIRKVKCGPGSIYQQDGLSRAAVFITGIQQIPQPSGAQIEPEDPWRIRLQVRVSNGYINMAQAEYLFAFVPNKWPAESRLSYRQGFVFQYGGPLCNQIEVWGKMDTNGAVVEAPSFTASFTIGFDRFGTPEQSILGSSTTATGITYPEYY